MSERTIFLAALDIAEPAERLAYLDRVCAGDAGLRAGVEALLAAHERSGNFLDQPAAEPAGTGAYGPERAVPGRGEGPGSRIGPYRLLEQIGEGGFGMVFLAAQSEPIRRKVALKVLKPGMDSAQVIARFEAERQALAIMDHPNIARVLDAGTTASGRPFFVMELVRGIAITAYSDQKQLNTDERLALFTDVCAAVQHAHTKGIIHRDIKPSNVLVTLHDGKAVVKVIDFGIAKAIGQELTERTLLTGFAQMIGTPLYMSPEQAALNALDVDTRSDVYSLGVLLYELLTGTTPFDAQRLARAGYDEMRRIIREEEPPRPSTRISTLGHAADTISTQRQSDPNRLSQVIRGELDWIVMKALEKDRNRRYESPSAFAADVQRYLDDEPVLACPPSAWYRFKKIARRNRVALATAAVLLAAALLLAGGIGWTIQKEAGRLAKSTEKTDHALDEVARWQARSKWPEARAALERAQAVLDSGGGPAGLRRRVDELGKDLHMVERLEAIRMKRIRSPDSLRPDYRVTDRAYAEAFREFDLLDVDNLNPADAAGRIRARSVAIELAATLDDWAWVRRNQLKMPAARWRRLVETAVRADPDSWRNRARKAAANKDWASLRELARSADLKALPPKTLHLLGMNLSEGSDADFVEAMRFLRRAHWYHPDDFWINHELGARWRWQGAVPYAEAALALRGQNVELLHHISLVYLDRNDHDAAIGALETILGLDPPDFDRALAHHTLGSAWLAKGDFDKALAEYRKAVRSTSDPWIHSQVHYSTAGILEMKGKLDEAIAEYRKAIRLRRDYVAAHNNLGVALRKKGDRDGALDAFREAIRHNQKAAQAHSNLSGELRERKGLAGALEHAQEAVRLRPNEPSYHVSLGNALHDLGRLDDAIDSFRRAIRLRPDLAMAHFNLGLTLNEKGDHDGAIVAFQEALRLRPGYVGADANLAELFQARRSFEKSVAHWKRAIELEPKNAALRYNLGQCLSQKGDRAGAITSYREAIALRPKHSAAWNNLGVRLFEQGKYRDAAEAHRQAVAGDPKNAQAQHNLGAALEMIGRLDEAIAAYRQAVRLEKGYANARGNLGYALARRGDLDGGIAELQESVRLEPADASAQHRLGIVLSARGDLERAAAALRRAIALAPHNAEAHCDLGKVLRQQGQFARSLASFQLGHDLGSRQPGWQRPSAEWVRQAERLVEVNALLPLVLRGKVKPPSAARWLDLALVCTYRQQFGAAANFYLEAFTDRPALGNDLSGRFRYGAACVAALAGGGRDVDALGDAERARWRRQALTWLRADLALWGRHLEKGTPQVRAEVERALGHWQRNAALASLREGPALDRLPEAERDACRRLWADVEDTLRKARAVEGQPPRREKSGQVPSRISH